AELDRAARSRAKIRRRNLESTRTENIYNGNVAVVAAHGVSGDLYKVSRLHKDVSVRIHRQRGGNDHVGHGACYRQDFNYRDAGAIGFAESRNRSREIVIGGCRWRAGTALAHTVKVRSVPLTWHVRSVGTAREREILPAELGN